MAPPNRKKRMLESDPSKRRMPKKKSSGKADIKAGLYKTLRGASKANRAVNKYITDMSLVDVVLWTGGGGPGPKALLAGAKASAGKAKKVFNFLRRKKSKAKPTLKGRPGAITENGHRYPQNKWPREMHPFPRNEPGWATRFKNREYPWN